MPVRHLSLEAQGMLSFLLERYHEVKRLGIRSTNALTFGMNPDQFAPLVRTSNPCIAYAPFCTLSGFEGYQESSGRPLLEIKVWCESNGLPGLHCLAVYSGTGNPGPGYPTRAGVDIAVQWRDDIIALLDTFEGEMPTGQNWRSWETHGE
jgi:hypothetical protein